MKLKDFVTMGNLVAGFAAVIALFEIDNHRLAFEWSCYLIYIGYAFDILDGPVARWTKQHDTFGAIFDSLCDFVTNSMAPSYIIYYFYVNIAGYHWLLAAAIGSFPIVMGTIRQAKQQDQPLSYPCYWIGLPRPVLTIFILALLNSSIFTFGLHQPSPWSEILTGGAAALIVFGSFLHLSRLPFANHHGRRWMMFLRFGMFAFRYGAFVVLGLGWVLLNWPGLVYDYLLFNLVIYIGLSWTQNTREDLSRIRTYLDGGELVKPLVHRDSDWRAKSLAPYYCEKNAGRE